MDAPKKIWRVEQNGYASGPDVPYIRADLVDGLVEALEELCYLKEATPKIIKARAALKALEENNE